MTHYFTKSLLAIAMLASIAAQPAYAGKMPNVVTGGAIGLDLPSMNNINDCARAGGTYSVAPKSSVIYEPVTTSSWFDSDRILGCRISKVFLCNIPGGGSYYFAHTQVVGEDVMWTLGRACVPVVTDYDTEE